MTGDKEGKARGGNGPMKSESILESRGTHTQIIGSGLPMSQTGNWGFSTFADELQVKYLYSVQ
jgi:hypothetical protein